MACVNIINVNVLDNPCAFTNPFQFEVTFECLTKLDDGQLPNPRQKHNKSLTLPSPSPLALPRHQTWSGVLCM